MVISLYSFLFIRNGHHYIYNTLSNALLEIDQYTYNQLYNALQNNESLDIESFDPKLRDILEDKYFMTDNSDEPEFIVELEGGTSMWVTCEEVTYVSTCVGSYPNVFCKGRYGGLN